MVFSLIKWIRYCIYNSQSSGQQKRFPGHLCSNLSALVNMQIGPTWESLTQEAGEGLEPEFFTVPPPPALKHFETHTENCLPRKNEQARRIVWASHFCVENDPYQFQAADRNTFRRQVNSLASFFFIQVPGQRADCKFKTFEYIPENYHEQEICLFIA